MAAGVGAGRTWLPWSLICGGLLLFVALALALVGFIEKTKLQNELGLPLVAIAGVVALLGALALVSVSFSLVGMSDQKQALGLPSGSVRAVIALSLVVLFAILTVFLFSSLRSGGVWETERCLTADDAARARAGVQGRDLMLIRPMTLEEAKDCAVKEGEHYQLRLRTLPNPAGEDFAKQLLVLIGTLVTSVASFYFGARAVSQAGDTVKEIAMGRTAGAGPGAPPPPGDPADASPPGTPQAGGPKPGAQAGAAATPTPDSTPVPPQVPAAQVDAALRSVAAGSPLPVPPMSVSTPASTAADASAQDGGLADLLADALATVKGLVKFAGPVVTGIPGGPVGIVAGVVLGGLAAAQDRAGFAALKSALLRAPYDPALLPSVPDGNSALAALQSSRLMAASVADVHDPGLALRLMQAALRRAPGGGLLPSETVAAALLAEADPALVPRFDTVGALAAALDDYRGGLVFTEAAKRLSGTVDIPAIGGAPAVRVGLPALVQAVSALGADPRAAATVERLVAITEGLAKLPAGSTAVVDQVTRALEQASALVAADARQSTEVRE